MTLTNNTASFLQHPRLKPQNGIEGNIALLQLKGEPELNDRVKVFCTILNNYELEKIFIRVDKLIQDIFINVGDRKPFLLTAEISPIERPNSL